MIPMFMIENLISERGRTQEEAINEVSEKWSLAQTVTGPYPVSYTHLDVYKRQALIRFSHQTVDDTTGE